MTKTLKTEQFREIFKDSLRLNARTMSIKTLLSERNLKRIDYSPYYQRNYVWDNAKQTFFIESVILGTEIPPLILFKSGKRIEVIDGRQRFETLKKFKENEITLKIKGLKELQILDKQSFNKLNDNNKEIFLSSNIRVFEFEIINQPNLNDDIIDHVKKEIFRRYNTGITPLSRDELDNAKYDEDEFSDLFKAELRNNFPLLRDFNLCFFPKQDVAEGENNESKITKNVDFIRKYRVLKSFPISTYAAGSNRTETFELLYDFARTNTVDEKLEFKKFYSVLKEVIAISKTLSFKGNLNNRLIFECILWAITIMQEEGIPFHFDEETFQKHYSENLNNYSESNSHYYRDIIARYTDTATFFNKNYDFDFLPFIRNDEFREKLAELRQSEFDAAKSIDELSNLRSNKPNPISTPIEEIKGDLKTTRYLLRPSYQRQEKINILKASSIIESILLGINLPPIFIFKKLEKVKEVVDGQQRLLAILGFLGEQYTDENGELLYSKNNNFKLKGLKILTDLEGSNYSALSEDQQDKILDFVIDLIIIEQEVNHKFDPIDLFIRLNYKPYPIKENSFEMWNSIVNHKVIKKIKETTADSEYRDWFFLRETLDGRPDRMQNEEMITVLSALCYMKMKDSDDLIGFFPRQDRITCRLKNKKALTSFLLELDQDEKEKSLFISSIEKTHTLIKEFGLYFGDNPTKEDVNEYLNVKKSRTFRRSLQDFYVIWLIIENVSNEHFENSRTQIFSDIRDLLSRLKNVSDADVDQKYVDSFHANMRSLHERYN